MKKSRIYWGAETDRAILEYNAAADMVTRNRIYSERLHSPCCKLVECVFNRFKFDYCQGSHQSIKDEALAAMVSKFSYFNENKGKGYSYFSILVKNYFIVLNDSEYKARNRFVELASEDSDENSQAVVLACEDPPVDGPPEIDYLEFGEYWKREYAPKVLERDQRLVAFAFGNALQSAQEDWCLNGSRKVYTRLLSKATGVDVKRVGLLLRRLAPKIKEAFESYLCLETPLRYHEKKVTKETVEEVCRLAKEGMTQQRIALLVGFDQTTVSKIVCGQYWKEWLPEGFVWRDGEYNPKGEGNPNAILTREKALAVRADYVAGLKFRELSAKYGVHQATIERVVYGFSWGFDRLPGRKRGRKPKSPPVPSGETLIEGGQCLALGE